jgi:hypothetical protein
MDHHIVVLLYKAIPHHSFLKLTQIGSLIGINPCANIYKKRLCALSALCGEFRCDVL